MPENKENKKRIWIGPLLLKVLEKQRDNLKAATYGCLDDPSYSLAGEIIAKKVLGLA